MIESILHSLTNSVLGDYACTEQALKLLLTRVPSEDPISKHLHATQAALRSGDWREVGELFNAQRFVDRDGWFLLMGPYSIVRSGKTVTCPTAVVGRVLEARCPSHLKSLAQELFGRPVEELSPLMAVEIHAGVGNAGSEAGEAFLVPDGWAFPESERGPALNDMREQRRRYLSAGRACITRIFEDETADLLLSAMDTSEPWYSLQHTEFSYHEIGHATGIGLKRKLASDLLATPWYRAVEEWRADGVSFELMAKSASAEGAGRVIAANLVLRFGIDAQRGGGMDRDTDVNASLLTFDRLLASGSLRVGKERKLKFQQPGYAGLLASVLSHRQDAIQLTRDESALGAPEGIWGLYGSIHVARSSRSLFQDLIVEPCRGLYSTLN